jgi:hypothetical protein
MLVEERKGPRRRLDRPVEALNAFTGAVVGRFENLAAEGLMLLTPEMIEPETVVQIRCQLPSMTGNLLPFEFGVQVLWSRAHESGTGWRCGCRVIDIAPELGELLALWSEDEPARR